MAHHLPTRDDYVEMLHRIRATTAEDLEEANRTGNVTMLLLYQLQLAKWDRLIARVRADDPLL